MSKQTYRGNHTETYAEIIPNRVQAIKNFLILDLLDLYQCAVLNLFLIMKSFEFARSCRLARVRSTSNKTGIIHNG